MNTNTRNSRILNSMLPLGDTQTSGTYMSYLPSFDPMYMAVGTVAVVVLCVLFYVFQMDIEKGWTHFTESVTSLFSPSLPSASTSPSTSTSPSASASPSPEQSPDSNHITSVLEKVLPTGGNQVFNVSSNKYTYYDAEPLCKALGAELATYEQVKEAWSHGADWCNYGWVKGQLAVYPTSKETYAKTQSGPEAGKNVCGLEGVNGGYFDNPEMRFGVTCYGNKPKNNLQSDAHNAKNTPTSPDALAYDNKVAEFKREADSIGILPFNGNTWN